MYQLLQPVAGRPGFFGAFATLTYEGARQELLEQFAAKATKVDCTTCSRCDGKGYTKADGRVGCGECHGRGVHVHE